MFNSNIMDSDGDDPQNIFREYLLHVTQLPKVTNTFSGGQCSHLRSQPIADGFLTHQLWALPHLAIVTSNFAVQNQDLKQFVGVSYSPYLQNKTRNVRK